LYGAKSIIPPSIALMNVSERKAYVDKKNSEDVSRAMIAKMKRKRPFINDFPFLMKRF